MGLAGELVVVSDNLMGVREIAGVGSWAHALEALDRVSRQIRDTTLDLRMVPVDELFSRFPRVVRDLADRSGKEIELRIIGQETRLDRTIVERLNDPMIHLIRNAVDHALENPQDRLAKGKPRLGRITLSAGHEGDRVAIRVEDDGRGLDRDKIVRKGIVLGMVPTGTPADDPRVVSLIFEPGFSTRDTISELSGRGVGLDVVRDAVRALRGSVAVESTPGKGTAFIFRLPLTLALIDGLLVETAGGKYVVPLAQVEECVALNGTGSALSEGRPCVAVRGELVPMVSLRALFHADGPLPPRQELLLTRHAGQRVGVAVDQLLGRVQAVIQSLGEGMHGLNRFSGATILGDGSVSLILDLSALVSESRFAEQKARTTPSTRREGGELPMRFSLRTQITTALVLFGLVPASIVAWFAYRANDDFREKQTLVIRQAAASISDHVASVLLTNPKSIAKAVDGGLEEKEKRTIWNLINKSLGQFAIESAQVYVVSPDNNNKLLVKRTNQVFDSNLATTALPTRYMNLASQDVNEPDAKLVEPPTSDSDAKTELVGYAPVHLGTVESAADGKQVNADEKHGLLLTLVIVPKEVAFATIVKNQTLIFYVLGAVIVLTLILGWLLRPLAGPSPS